MNRNNLLKKIFIIIIIISFLFSFNIYTNSSEDIDDMAYVMAIGIDTDSNEKYKISLQLSTMESSATDAMLKTTSSSSGGSSNSSGSSESDTASKYVVYTMETDSIDSAINIANAYVNKNINLSHCKILVMSEEIAKNGVEDIVNSIINKVEVRPDCNIVISKVPADEFDDTKSQPKIEDVLSKYYDVTSNIESGRGYSETVKLSDFYLKLNDSFYQAYATLGITSNPSSNRSNKEASSNLDVQSRSLVSNPDESAVETIGLAVFNHDKLVGTLSANQTMAYQLITNNFNYCTLNMPSPFSKDETLDLYLSTLKNPKIKVSIVNGSPFVEVNLYITTRLLSFNSNNISTLTEENLYIIKNSVTKYLEEQVYDYFDTTSKKFNSDIAGIGRYAAKNFKTTEEWKSYNWLENYENCTFKVNVDISIKSGHILSNE